MSASFADLLTGLAARVSTSLTDYMQDHRITGDELASEQYKRLMETLAELERGVEADIAADRSEVGSGLLWLVTNLFSLGRRGREFDRRVRALIEEVRQLLAQVRSIIEQHAEPRLPVPDELLRVSQRWRGAAREAELVNRSVPQLRRVSGWEGWASSEYDTMVHVQSEASKEFQHLPEVLASSYAMYSNLNKAVLSAVERVIRQFDVAAQAQPFRLFTSGFYVRTAARRAALVQLLETLPGMLLISDNGSGSVSETLRRVRQATNVVRHGWPSGTALAGARAGDTSAEISLHTSTQSAGSVDIALPVEGIRR